MLDKGREALGTTALDGEPDVILKMPGDSYAPFWLSVALLVFFAGLALTAWWLAALGLVGMRRGHRRMVMAAPRTRPARRRGTAARIGSGVMSDLAETLPERARLPIGSPGERSGGWWGCLTLVATEAALFGYLIFSYLYLASQTTQRWPPEGMPKLGLGGANTVHSACRAACSCGRASVSCGAASAAWACRCSLIAIVLGVIFVAIQLKEWHDHPYGLTTHLYGSLYFTITGFHMMHVLVGLVVLAFLLLWTALGYFDRGASAALTIGGLYWHFVDVVWLFIFATLYLSPYVLAR